MGEITTIVARTRSDRKHYIQGAVGGRYTVDICINTMDCQMQLVENRFWSGALKKNQARRGRRSWLMVTHNHHNNSSFLALSILPLFPFNPPVSQMNEYSCLINWLILELLSFVYYFSCLPTWGLFLESSETFIPFTTYGKTSFTEWTGRNFLRMNGFSGPKRFRDFRETDPWSPSPMFGI